MDDEMTGAVRRYAVKLVTDWDAPYHPADANDHAVAAILDRCALPARRDLYPAILAEARRLFDSGEVRPHWQRRTVAAGGGALQIVSGEPGYSYPLLVTDMSPDDELGVQIGDRPNGTGGSSVALTVDAARVLRDYLNGWIASKETRQR